MAGVGDKISTVTKEVSSVKEDVTKVSEEVSGVKATVTEVSEEVSGVGSKVENIKKEVEGECSCSERSFAKLNERQKQSLNEIFTKYEQNKVKLSLEFTHKGGFLGAEKKEHLLWTQLFWPMGPLLTHLYMLKRALFGFNQDLEVLFRLTVKLLAKS